MKTVRRRTTPTEGSRVPPLHNGDRLTQAEFHRRYQAQPSGVKAELIAGVVFMPSPVLRRHGTYHPELSLVLSVYKAFTPGLEVADNMTTILDDKGEPQPDLMLRIETEFGGQSRYNDEDYLVGAPELVAEIAHNSQAIDLGPKRSDYMRAGVQEYIVFTAREHKLYWFHFPSRRQLRPDRQGVWRSRLFGGLWLDGPALIARDSARLLATVQEGLASSDHQAFADRLAAARKRR